MWMANRDVNLADRWCVARAEHQKQGADQFCVLSDQCVSALSALWCPHRERLFGWPYDGSTRQWVHLTRHFRKIISAAELAQPRQPFQQLRRTHASYQAAMGGDACLSLGHSSSRITRDSYIDPRIATLGQAERLPRLKDSEGPMWYI